MRNIGTSFRKPSRQSPAILLCADVIECEYAARGVTTQRSKGLLKRQGPALIECVENTPLRLPPPDYPGDCRALKYKQKFGGSACASASSSVVAAPAVAP